MPETAQATAAALPREILDRLPEAAARAHAAVARAAPAIHADPLLLRARTAGKAAQRVHWLRKAVVAWAQPLEPHAACQEGCSHCCHIEVAMTDIEAHEIGERIRVAPSQVPQALPVQDAMAMAERGERPALSSGPRTDAGYAAPCPFLARGRCSIHAWRPLMCRVHLNLDRDDLLCRLVPGQPIPVPYADARLLKALYLLVQPAARLADVRAFFPHGLGERA